MKDGGGPRPLPVLDRPFADKLLAMQVSDDATSFRFVAFADFVCRATGGRVVRKLGAPWMDEAYWDIEAGPHVLVLHYEHYLGVFLCAGSPEAEGELERLLPAVREYLAPRREPLLLAAGALSALVAALHVAIIFAGAPAYRYFGAGERMARLAERGSSEPALVTTVLAFVFAVWGAYAFSGAGLIPRLPRLRTALLLIGLIYAGRGLAVLPQAYFWISAGSVPLRHVLFSAASLAIGLAYLIGTYRAWPGLTAAEGDGRP